MCAIVLVVVPNVQRSNVAQDFPLCSNFGRLSFGRAASWSWLAWPVFRRPIEQPLLLCLNGTRFTASTGLGDERTMRSVLVDIDIVIDMVVDMSLR